jgi:hypothetical protein
MRRYLPHLALLVIAVAIVFAVAQYQVVQKSAEQEAQEAR